MSDKRKPKCPTCRAEISAAGNKYFPFCSSRCQMSDLGRWLAEEYRVPVPITERDVGALEQLIDRTERGEE